MNNLSRFFLFCLITLTTVAKSQTTYSWASYPTRCSGASVYTQPNMTVSVSGSGFSNRGPQAAASSCASTAGNRYFSPKYVTTGNASAPDWQQTGLGIGVDWSNIVSNPPNSTVDVVFTNAVCTPLNFSIYDINSGTCCGVSVIWKDIVTISAVDGLGNTIYPLGANVTPMTGGNSYNAGTGTITAGNYGATNSVTNISFPSTQVAAIKSLKIVYRSGAITNDPYTVSATDPDPQYIIISNITASSPTVAISASAIPCGSTTTTLSSTTNATSATYSWTGSAGTSISSPTAANTSVTGTGTYTLTVVSGGVGGCTASSVYTVTASGSAPNITMAATNEITCSSTSVNISGSSSTPGVTYAWTGPGAISPSNLATGAVSTPGTYTLTVTETASGCTNTGTVSVTGNTTIPPITLGANQTIDCINTTANLSGGSIRDVNYLWTGPGVASPNNTQNTSVTTAGVYTLTVTDILNGCVNTGTVSVTSLVSPPNITTDAAQTLTCATTSVIVSGNSSTAGVNFSWTGSGAISPSNTNSGSVSSPGIYTLTVTNPANGCTSTGTVLVSQNTTPPSLSMGANQTITCTNTTANISGTSLTSGVNYSWSGPGVITPNNQSSGTVSASGTYTLTVTDPSNSCFVSNTVEVLTNTVLPDLSAGNSQTITCSTSSVLLTGSSTTSGLDYSWSGASAVTPNNQAIGSVSAAGTYTLTVTDPTNGCSNTSSVVVSENTTLPNISMSSNQIIDCISSSAIISGSTNTSGVIYSWAGPGIINPSNAASGSVTIAGTYSLTITDPSNGCSVMGTIDVANNSSAPIITMGLNQVINCNTTSVSINGNSNVSGVIYSWSGPGTINPNNTSSGMVSVAGTYTLLVTDPSNGCSSSGTIDVIDNSILPALTMSSDQTLDCVSSTAIVSGASTTTGVTYTWSGPGSVSPSNLASGSVTIAGTYTLLVSDPSNNCSTSGTINVLPSIGPSQPVITASGSTSFCAGDSIVLSSSSLVNNVWSNGATTQSIVVSTAGVYSVTISDGSGCVAVSAPVTAVVNQLPIVNANASSVNVCFGTNVILNGSGANTYTWTGNAIDGVAFAITSSQTYTVTGTDLNGCLDTAVVSINVNDLPAVVASINNPMVCEGSSVILTGSGLGTGGSYVWSGGVNDNVSFVPNSSTTYTVTGTDVNGCIDTATVSVVVNTPPTAPVITTIGSGTSVCSGQSIILSSNPSSDITWQPNGETSATIVVSNSGVYSASITDANSCTSLLSSISVVINPSPIINVSALSLDTVKCGGVNGSINNVEITGGTQPYTYNWINSTTNLSVGSSLTLTNVVTGNYQMIVEDANGCSDSSAVILLPSAGGVSVNLTGTPLNGMDPLDVNLLATTTGSVITYNWYLNSSYTITTSLGTHSLLGLTFGNYTASVVVLDQYGCLDTAEVTIFVDSEIKVVIPNVFTPNGDNINEVFSFELKGVKNFEAQIFNRWGQKLYSWNALNGGWDGKLSNGEWASEGTYYFIVDYTDVEDVKVNKAGYFLLVK